MEQKITSAESWSVSYGCEVYSDARLFDGQWYFRTKEDFVSFPDRGKIAPICKNLTRRITSVLQIEDPEARNAPP
jgi:hypothetical protein